MIIVASSNVKNVNTKKYEKLKYEDFGVKIWIYR